MQKKCSANSKNEMANRDNDLFMAKLALKARRSDDSLRYIKEAIVLGPDLTEEERRLLEDAYLSEIGKLRGPHRLLKSLKQKALDRKAAKKGFLSKMKRVILVAFGMKNKATVDRGDVLSSRQRLAMLDDLSAQIELELRELCDDMLRMLDVHLIPAASTSEASVLYHKMKADSYRYLGEIASSETRQAAVRCSLDAYTLATDTAKSNLAGFHPIRLRLALNFAELYREFLHSPENAKQVALSAVVDAYAECNNAPEAWREELRDILELLEENLRFYREQAAATVAQNARQASTLR